MEKVKVRINNSHKHIWAVVWNGQPEDFSDAKDITLIASVRDKRINLTQGIDYVIEGNLVKIDFTPRFCKNTGVYNIELNYTKPSESFLSGERRTAVDLNVIEIVGTSACADATDETSSVSEAAFGFQGLSAYEVWLKDNPESTKEDYFNWLQKPATDAVSLIDAKIDELDTAIQQESERVESEDIRLSNEQSRVEAEDIRLSNEQSRVEAEDSRISAETSRASNENQRTTKEIARETAEGGRVQAENERETAEQARVDAEIVREQQEQARQTNTAIAIENANNAKGWTPSTVFEEYNGKQIKKLVGYIGGTGVEPTENVGQYYTENGFTNNKDLAVNFKGSSVEAMIQTRDSYNQIPEPRNPNTLYFISNQA